MPVFVKLEGLNGESSEGKSPVNAPEEKIADPVQAEKMAVRSSAETEAKGDGLFKKIIAEIKAFDFEDFFKN